MTATKHGVERFRTARLSASGSLRARHWRLLSPTNTHHAFFETFGGSSEHM
jgi:hypothetical protein